MDGSEQQNDLLRAIDPATFMDACKMEPDPWQADYLRADKDTLLLCSRQSGKSTTSAVKAVHRAKYYGGSLVLLLSPSLRQSGELFRKVLWFCREAGIEPVRESALQLELPNGSRIVSLPGKEETVRGFSGVSLLLVDEASRVPDELYYSVRPMLAVSGGSMVALTTPFGKRGWFHKEWTDGGKSWLRFKVTARDCPRISEEFLAKERATLGEWWFKQEYMCEFVQTLDCVFSYEAVQSAISPEVKPLFEDSIP